MTIPPSIPANNTLPDRWRASVAVHLTNIVMTDNEEIQGWLEINLDARLHFAQRLLLLTDQRLLSFSDSPSESCEYRYRAGLRIRRRDYGGVGRIELFDGVVRQACWFYTLAHDAQATRFVKQFEQQLAGFLSGIAVPRSAPECCPDCLTPYPDDSRECAYCNATLNAPPLELDAVPPVAFCQTLPVAIARRILADAGFDRRHAGAALPHHPADG